MNRTLDQIIERINQLELTAYAVSKRVPVSIGAVRKILNGESKNPNAATVQMLNEFLDEVDGIKQNVVMEETATYITGSNVMMIPVVGQRAQAGFLLGYGDNEYLESLPKIPYEVDKEYRGNYVCFEVSGDSMDNGKTDAILENDVLVCREVGRQHWCNKLHINKWDFVLVHKEMGIVVKRITDHNTKTGKLKLHSLNDFYEDYEVNIDDLIAIFSVVDINRSRRR